MKLSRSLALALLTAVAATTLLSDSKKGAPPTPADSSDTGVLKDLPQVGKKKADESRPEPVKQVPNAPVVPVVRVPRATSPVVAGDPILRAMKDELERTQTMNLAGYSPYYIEYYMEDGHSFNVSASLGAIVGSGVSHSRIPQMRIRVGDYKFDNSNYLYSDYYAGTRYDPETWPIDDDYKAFRRDLWLGSDRTFKTAVEAIARKKAAMQNVNSQNQDIPDFWKGSPVQKILPVKTQPVDQAKWTDHIRDLSKVFEKYPEVLGSQVAFQALQGTRYMENSEGAAIRTPDNVFYIQTRVLGQASDGMTLRDSIVFQALDIDKLPAQADMEKAVTDLGEHIRQLAAAPVGETYSGPVLFEGAAAPQLLAELLGANLNVPRKPISEPGRNYPFYPSDLEGRVGSRILPEFLDVVDDPTQTAFNGVPLFGTYEIDDEGVAAPPLTIVEKGYLKTLLLTRQPVKGFNSSNGRARLPGASGASTATMSNLIVRSSQSVPLADLKKQMMQMCQQRNKPYGIIVRKMDFPSSASVEEVRRIMQGISQSGSASKPVSIPLLAYRVYPNGKEELIRGVRFRALNVRALKDITAVSSETQVFNFLNNLAPFALMGAGGYIAAESVVAPSLLFDDLELEKPQEDMPKLPVVPPPALTASR
jgi:TldD protein